MFVDAHLHLNDFKDCDLVVARAEEAGVKFMLTNGCDLSSSQKAVELADEFKIVYAAVGVHPENLNNLKDNYLEVLERQAKNKKVVAIGEIGLDYHFRDDNKELQKKVFIEQIELANKLNLPVIVHSRDAIADTIEILKTHRTKRDSLLHCYGGSYEMAKEFLKLGFYFSFGGVCTFKNAKNAVVCIENLPIEKILTETDAPYLAPEPYRGTRNESKYIPIILDKIAKIKNMSFEETAKIIEKNTKTLFNV